MALTPMDEAAGMKAYEQARAFERLRSWRLPVSYAVFVLVPVVSGVAMAVLGHLRLAVFIFLAAVFLAWMAWSHWKGLTTRYAGNRRLLEQLEKEHGEDLPWVAVEKHFRELEKLKQELKNFS